MTKNIDQFMAENDAEIEKYWNDSMKGLHPTLYYGKGKLFSGTDHSDGEWIVCPSHATLGTLESLKQEIKQEMIITPFVRDFYQPPLDSLRREYDGSHITVRELIDILKEFPEDDKDRYLVFREEGNNFCSSIEGFYPMNRIGSELYLEALTPVTAQKGFTEDDVKTGGDKVLVIF